MCENTVIVMTRRDGSDVIKECGTYFGGTKMLCDACLSKAEKDYPQGWQSYPGDTCKHGVYVGGCGIDYMCPRCELSEE
jgi:hypothetical protein